MTPHREVTRTGDSGHWNRPFLLRLRLAANENAAGTVGWERTPFWLGRRLCHAVSIAGMLEGFRFAFLPAQLSSLGGQIAWPCYVIVI